jgi:SAM-dependent methyltransferase
MSKKLYNEEFYDTQSKGSNSSAEFFAGTLQKVFRPTSVVDFGCGHGSWLRAFGRHGAKTLLGFDGPWVQQEDMHDPNIRFVGVDLSEKMIDNYGKFDLAISLETAEHLNPNASRVFIENIANHADVVIFGAAYEHQGGTNHINERKHTFWAQIFSELGYAPYDLFRPLAWGNPEVDFWYQQNTFLFVKESSDLQRNLKTKGILPIQNPEFMNCIHPELYNSWIARTKAIPNAIWSLMSLLSRVATLLPRK